MVIERYAYNFYYNFQLQGENSIKVDAYLFLLTRFGKMISGQIYAMKSLKSKYNH